MSQYWNRGLGGVQFLGTTAASCLSRYWRYGFAAVLLVVAVALSCVLWPREDGADLASSGKPLYLWCPKCGYEIACQQGQENQTFPCPVCQEAGVMLRLTATSHGGQAGGVSPYVSVGLVDATALLAIALLFFAHRRQVKDEEELLYFIHVCKKCRRRLRYLDRQVGHFGQCPACRNPFIFPEPTAPPIPAEELG